MPPGGSWPGLRFVNASSLVQTKIPELPPALRCRHCATSSKFVICLVERVTPTGVPLQETAPSFHVQVSGSPFTMTKSASPSDLQPKPVPSITAFGKPTGSS